MVITKTLMASKNSTLGNDTSLEPVSVGKFTGTDYGYLKSAWCNIKLPRRRQAYNY
jgi:hypothetical protein